METNLEGAHAWIRRNGQCMKIENQVKRGVSRIPIKGRIHVLLA